MMQSSVFVWHSSPAHLSRLIFRLPAPSVCKGGANPGRHDEMEGQQSGQLKSWRKQGLGCYFRRFVEGTLAQATSMAELLCTHSGGWEAGNCLWPGNHVGDCPQDVDAQANNPTDLSSWW